MSRPQTPSVCQQTPTPPLPNTAPEHREESHLLPVMTKIWQIQANQQELLRNLEAAHRVLENIRREMVLWRREHAQSVPYARQEEIAELQA